jgi:hypothetical protein
MSALAETLILPATNLGGVYSSPLVAGQLYEFAVVGTYVYGNAPNAVADAEWCDSYNWIEDGIYHSLATDALDVVIDDACVDWLGSADGFRYAPHTFSPNHTYLYRYVGTGSGVNFHVADLFPWGGDCTGDNSGFLTVVVSPVPEPSSLLALLCGLGGLAWRRRG